MNVLSYKHLALADINPPIVAIVPFRSAIDEDDSEWLSRIAQPDALAHAGLIFGRSFGSIEELTEFSLNFKTVDEVVAAIRKPERLLFDTEWRGPLSDQIIRAIKETAGLISDEQVGLAVLNQSVGRMMQANDILMKSRELLGTPLMDAPTSWQYLNWKLEYGAVPSPLNREPLHIVHALQRAGEEAEWLGKIPADSLIDMRRQGALEEIRSVIFDGVQGIAGANPNDFEQVSSRILRNLDDAYRKHREAMDKLKREKHRFYGYEIGGWLVKGTIGVAAAMTNNIGLALGTIAANEVLPGPPLREIPGRLRSFEEAEQGQRFTPMGLLFQYRDDG